MGDLKAMKSELARKNILVKKSSIQGYGVFANQDIEAQEVVEECYMLTIPNDIQCINLNDYIYTGTTHCGLALGYGSIYNHSDHPNTNHRYDIEKALLTITASRCIKKGEEIFISYGDNWFSSRRLRQKKPSLGYRLRQLLSPTLLILIRFSSLIAAFVVLLQVMKFFQI